MSNFFDEFDEFEEGCGEYEDDLDDLLRESDEENAEPEGDLIGWQEIAFLGAMSEAEAEKRRRRRKRE